MVAIARHNVQTARVRGLDDEDVASAAVLVLGTAKRGMNEREMGDG